MNEPRNPHYEKILRRARKLYARASDTSSPAEAAMAARAVRKLMDQEGITESDLESSDFGTTQARFNPYGEWLVFLAAAVARLNDCQSGTASYGFYEFRGFKLDAMIAMETLSYLAESAERLASAHLKAQRQAGNDAHGKTITTNFKLGFAIGVSSQIDTILEERKGDEHNTSNTGKSLVSLKLAMVKGHFGEYAEKHKGRVPEISTDSARGYVAGLNTSLDPQVTSESNTPLPEGRN